LETTLLANEPFWPPEMSDKKLYIRPYVKGLEGGDAISSAKSFVFVIQVFPINLPIDIHTEFNIIGMEGKRRCHEGGLGMFKASSNYAQTISDRELAKKGDVIGANGRKFNGVFYFSPGKQGLSADEEVLDEMASGNLLFIKCKKDDVEIYTPSLERETILPGIVRDTILQISKLSGYKVIEKDLTFNELKEMDLGLISGSALGLIKLGEMKYKGESICFSEKQNYKRSKEVFQYLYGQLLALRKGNSKDSVILEDSDSNSIINIYG